MEPFPFTLTLCRPVVLLEGFGRVPFVSAIVTDGLQEELRISSWPCLGPPFPLHARKVLCIRVFAGEDDAAFGQGRAEEVGVCHVPLWRLPSTLPARSPEALPELWLSLRAPVWEAELAPDRRGGWKVAESAEASLLRHFEQSLALAEQQPWLPRIRVLVQDRAEISSTMSTMMRPAAPVAAGDLEHTPGVRRMSDARSDLDTPQARAYGLASASAASLWTPANGAHGRQASDHFVSPPASALQPPVSGGLSDEMWRMKCEEERERNDERGRRLRAKLRRARAEASVAAQKLENLGEYVGRQALRCLLERVLVAWGLFLVEEKRRRQFGQLSEDIANFEDDSKDELTELSRKQQMARQQLQKRGVDATRSRARWAAAAAAAASLSERDASLCLAQLVVVVWRFRARRRRAGRGLLEAWNGLAQEELAQMVFALWRGRTGQRSLEELQERVRQEHLMAPQNVRRAASQRASDVLDFFGGQGPGTPLGSGSAELLSAVLLSWLLAAEGGATVRRQAMRLLVILSYHSIVYYSITLYHKYATLYTLHYYY